MIVLRDPKAVAEIADADLRNLLEQRFIAISQDGVYDPDSMGYFVVASPGDTLDRLEEATGYPIVHSWVNSAEFGDEDFAPGWEWLAEHSSCFEMVFVPNDGGFTLVLIIPKHPCIDPGLLTLCQTYADTTT